MINLLAGDGIAVSDVALADPRLTGIHFTGSTGTFQHLWREVGNNIDRYQNYPRIVGETGGKDFVLAHRSADVDAVATAIVRGSFEYQGQKCSAASRAFIPRSVWHEMVDDFLSATEALRYGDVTDLTNYGGAVIADDRSAVLAAEQRLRHAAGNFYVNDKPTGAVVGQQPFGGSRASGTNDKAGSALNLLRWTSARSIKETFVPPTDHNYPHMES